MSETGVNVIVDDFVLGSSPSCNHGPTLLFERKNSDKNGRFYACSACRDRKDCRFFMWEDDHRKRMATTTAKDDVAERSTQETETINVLGPKNSGEDDEPNRLKTILRLPSSQRRFCRNCWLLLLPSEWSEHDGHLGMNLPLSLRTLSRPTSLLAPLDNNKKEAQYFFTIRATKFIVSTAKTLMFTHVLCIGCPRIHERICRGKSNVKSFLLDIDARFRQFCSTSQFSRYNMFNHHFFDGVAGQERYRQFLRDSVSLLIVIDPPFGGLVDPLAHTITTIGREFRAFHQNESDCAPPRLIWVFPYFMEKRIVASMSDVTMLDYKVEYENHSSFKTKEGNGLRKKSPIRIFTNISPDTVVLPQSEGYRFCETCRRYVAPENNHCNDCGSCPSKDGRTYRHCSDCGVCVKPNYVHCNDCGNCHLPNECRSVTPGVSSGCFTCGDKSHKRRGCPRQLQLQRRKRRRK